MSEAIDHSVKKQIFIENKILVYDFLNSEFKKNPKLQEGKSKIHKQVQKADSEHDNIYQFKLESKERI